MLQPLRPFTTSSTLAGISLEAQLERAHDGLRLTFRLQAPDPRSLAEFLPSAPPATTGRKDELWKTTCFELFLGAENSPAYFELNASPAGDWAWYAFDAFRSVGMRSPPLASAAEPREIARRREEGVYETTWLLPAAALEGTRVSEYSITAVLDRGGAISYWALCHAGAEADFHRRDSFVRF